MKLSSAAIGLAAVGGLAAMGAGLVVVRALARARGTAPASAEPPAPEQLIGAPQAHLSATEAAGAFQADPTQRH